MSNSIKKAEEAIKEVFADTSVEAQTTYDRLKALKEVIDDQMVMLKEDSDGDIES